MADPAFDELVACSRFTDVEKVVYVLRRKSATARLAGQTTANVVPRLIPQFGTLKRLLVEWRSQGDSNAGPAEIVDLEPTFTTGLLPREVTLTEWTLQRRAAESLAYNRMLWRFLAFELERVQKGVDQIEPATSAPGWNRYLELDKLRLILPANEPGDLTDIQESRLERTLSLLSSDLPELKVGQKEFLERPLFDNFRQALDQLLTLYHNGTVRLPADTSSGARRRAVNDRDEADEARVTLHELRRLVEWLKRARVSELELKPLGVSELEFQLRARSNGTAQEARNDVIVAVSRMRSALIPPSTRDTRTNPLAVVSDEERSWRIERLDSALEHFGEILQANALAEQAPGNPTVIHQDAIELEEGEQIALFAGTCDPNLRTLRAVTNQSMKPVTGDVARPGSTTFLSSIPPRAKLLGHLAYMGQGRIEGFAPVYVEFEPSEVASAPWNPLHAMWPHAVSLGRFVPVDRQAPFRDDARIRDLASRTPSSDTSIDDQRAIRVAQQLVDKQSGTIHPHANYTSFPVCKLWFDVSGDVLLAIDDPETANLPVELRLKVVSPGGNLFRQVVEKNSAAAAPVYDLVFVSNGEFVLSRTHTDTQGKSQVSSTRYRTPDPVDNSLDPRDKLPWGATFSANQRPILAEFNVRGYHAGLLDPRNYQLSTGCSNNVFEWPADGSVDYQTTAVDKIIPRGLFYRNDREGSGSVRASVVTSSEEHKQAWSANAGLQVGFGGAEFKANAKYQQESAAMSSEEHGRTVSMTHEIKHALVLDRGTMRLSTDFTSRVLRLRDLYLAGELDTDWEYDNLVASFGTNYAYAVAYGGMAYQELRYDQNEQQQMTGRGFSFEADAKGSILGFK
ncbi:MAG: MAC/perforin domain-containing protein, partial [Planctomycetota bacterium]|nr:MAC/perforin domain-containing protein [Planctomycetota bacterium]